MAKASEQIDGLEFNHHNNRARSDSRHAQNHEQMARPNGPTIFLMLFCFSHQMLLFWLFPCSRFGFHAQTIVFLMHNWISHCESTFVCCHWHLQPASCNWDVPPIVSVFVSAALSSVRFLVGTGVVVVTEHRDQSVGSVNLDSTSSAKERSN